MSAPYLHNPLKDYFETWVQNSPCRGDVQRSRSSPGRVAQSVEHLTRKSGILGSIPGLATYLRFSFRFFKKGSCQLLAKVTLDVYRGRKTTIQQRSRSLLGVEVLKITFPVGCTF